jgi:hypothetical protein
MIAFPGQFEMLTDRSAAPRLRLETQEKEVFGRHGEMRNIRTHGPTKNGRLAGRVRHAPLRDFVSALLELLYS